MKKIVVFLVAIFASVASLSAQNYMVVDSEKVFKSIAEYNTALSELETLSASYQKSVDAKFEEVESLYSTYMSRRTSLTEAQRSAYESQILEKESEANEYQESLFSNDGSLMERRIELISPIQTKVFAAIENYAKANGFDLVLDLASNATVLYKSDKIDRTEAVIAYLK
ncbi:MAG: OmpH family outer membrane protein [Rikenellaceae bacterium]